MTKQAETQGCVLGKVIYILCPNFSVLLKHYFLHKPSIFASFKRSFPLFPEICRHKIVFLSFFLTERLCLEIQSSEFLECHSMATA